MKIEILKIDKENGGFSIWIDENQQFNPGDFFRIVSSLEIDKRETVSQSFGPAEIIEDIYTSKGKFSLHLAFDEYPGLTIYSENQELMNEIFRLMISSGTYHER
jgi:hypothetical protein